MIEKMTRDAFENPLPLSEMIRLTFITGAGKLGRQKYDDGAAKALTSTLRELGFEEDRGASAVLECAKTFKLQHDTGKNLKTVVVFPGVTGAGVGSAVGEALGGLSLDDAQDSLIPADSPEQKLAYSSMSIFERNIESKCQTWSQKKGCLAALDSLKETIQGLEEKLMTGTPLTDAEQECYDAVSLTSLEQKQTHVKDLMHKQVADGMITADEKRTLLHQVNERLEKLTADIAEAGIQSKPKRVQNLTANKAKVLERKAMLESISPKPSPPLKNEAAINKLRRELVPLEDIEEKAKGRLLTLKESQAVAKKEELLEDILEQEVCTWLDVLAGYRWVACSPRTLSYLFIFRS